jgi:DNA-binding CsgD family transcriptional regulator
VRCAQQRHAEARNALTEAAAIWAALGNRRESARTRIALLDTMLAAGGAAEGLPLGRQLLDDLADQSLPREREMVRRMLRRAGVRTRPATQSVPGNGRSKLTSREEAVLREVAQGHTNREIAERLGIAEKTVSVHVSHILAKLGCRTRTQAARFVPQ